MKRNFRFVTLTLVALMVFMMGVTPALAQDLTLALDATVALEGTLPTPAEDYTIRMTAGDKAWPMPQGSVNGQYDLVLTGASTGTFPVITYTDLGVYTYTITQIAGSNADCTYDTRSYNLTVYVLNDDKGGVGITTVLVDKAGTDKLADVQFKNVYVTMTDAPTDAPTNTPEPKDGEETKTGVVDNWPWYLGGCLVLLAVGGVMIYVLRRKEGGANGKGK